MIETVVGAQWGDEGKGKVVAYLGSTGNYDSAARWNGGPNAGHTVMKNGIAQVWRMLPACAPDPNIKRVYLGRGVVINPDILALEVQWAKEDNPDLDVIVDPRAHMISQSHVDMDEAHERERGIGSTKLGVGPAQADRALRLGQTAEDFYFQSSTFPREGIRLAVPEGFTPMSPVLACGAHGVMLDLYHGHYPYVTSSVCTPSGVSHGLGVSNAEISDGAILGVVKAYTTVVGAGPMHGEFPSLDWAGTERGSVTGRVRRIGALNLPMLRYADAVSSFDSFILTRVDGIQMDTIPVITHYSRYRRTGAYIPQTRTEFEEANPITRHMPMWSWERTPRDASELPKRLLDYIHVIEDVVGVKVGMVSVGRETQDMVMMP